ncbi:MAG: diacylglycerol kinase family protein [Clostridia bacterium]|nr:diacylglycerol kinase family protein [Clostridia bacterium]
MKKYHVLYNPMAGQQKGNKVVDTLTALYGEGNVTFTEMPKINKFDEYLRSIPKGDVVVLCGGDGTLNYFANKIRHIPLPCDVYYWASGSGNDFWRDIEGDTQKPVLINAYLHNLPSVVVKGQEYLFLNGVGYGIDGYCCEEGDKLRAKSDKPVNYTAVAIKGLLFHYKPTDAVVVVDGKEYTFEKVWLAPTMFGRFYGGGMWPAPGQTRQSDTLSLMVFHGCGPLKTLMIFPSLFKGEHIKYDKNVTVLSGKEITVRYKQPKPLQIDGETVVGVSEYTARR